MVLGYLTPREYLHRVRRMELVDDDIIIASYPQTCTTPIEQIVLMSSHPEDFDKTKGGAYITLPFLDHSLPEGTNGIKLFEASGHPRILRTFLPYQCIPRQADEGVAKCIYIMRNPKDALVDLYHMYKTNTLLGKFPGTWSDFFELVLANNVCYGDIFYHYLSWWLHRGQRNVLIINFEDILRDRRQMIETITSFCDQTAVSSAKMHQITEAVSNFAVQPSTWKKYFTVEQNEVFNTLMHERLVESGLDLFLDI
ncbi:sulfotransferase 1C4-like [Lineus longissimus]|uniref:sulfotransferase 1C4-like n=1 Tax=Lineus longissimus TaxID=88925 RepID=UPI00315D18A8